MIRFEHITFWPLVGLFALLAVPIVLLGLKSLAGLGPVRRWVALGARLLVLLAFLVLIAGARWDRINKDVEVIVLRDVSESTRLMSKLPAPTLRDAIDLWLDKTIQTDQARESTDRIGVISFDNQAYVDAIPASILTPTARAVREGGNGTDVASAIQLGLATKSYDDTSGGAMKRLVLIWDGNATQGDLDKAIDLAKANNVPIDVMPLDYEAKNEVVVERFVAPTWRKENEPFSIDVILRSTNLTNVSGDLTVLHQGTPMDLNDREAGMQTRRRITLKPGINKVSVPVPALADAGVHQFKAIFEAPNVNTVEQASPLPSNATRPVKSVADTLLDNNVANAFTFVRGKGKVLYVDNEGGLRSSFLRAALKKEGIELDENRVGVDQFPTSMVDLQDYEAVILQNIPRGQGGLSEDQQAMLVAYVHDMGGGLVMIGGEETFGAGGWQNSKLEEILPVQMEIPAERNIPKGALALIMHSCEMPNGNFWGIQCGIKAVETLSPRDEVGVLSYAWRGAGQGNTSWDFPLSERGDGTRPIEALKNMQLGDMPDFDDAMSAALGEPGKYGLLDSDARMKHAIIISDGDPQPPSNSVLQKYIDNKISVSTIVVYPHDLGNRSTMKDIAEKTGGRSYGPIEDNPGQLPEIFTKEASVVRRSLISENKAGIEVKATDSPSEIISGIDLNSMPKIYGLVLTSAKPKPEVEMPLVAGEKNDPLFVHWQTGLGKSAVFTSDAWNKWAADWVGSDVFEKFWSQVVRGVSRPAESSDFDVTVSTEGTKGKIVVEAIGQDQAFQNFLTIRGSVVGPDLKPKDVTLTQTQPGVYEAEFDAKDAGNYVVGLVYWAPQGKSGIVRSGTVVNSSPELRQLKSDRAPIQEIIDRTGGRLLTPFDPNVSLFTRVGLHRSTSPRPIWDILLPLLMALILLDIAIRRIAWDYHAMKRGLLSAIGFVVSYTQTRKVETTQSIDALRDIRSRKTESKPTIDLRKPDSSKKFEGEGVQGDISKVVGGATNESVPSKKSTREPPPSDSSTKSEGGMGSLMDAKRKAQEEIKRREEGKK